MILSVDHMSGSAKGVIGTEKYLDAVKLYTLIMIYSQRVNEKFYDVLDN